MGSEFKEIRFLDKTEIRNFLEKYCERNNKPMKIGSSSTSYYQVKCSDENCSFNVRFGKRQDAYFHCTYFSGHDCEESNTYKPKRNSIVTKIKYLQDNLGNLTPKECVKMIKTIHGQDIDYHTAYRSIKDLSKDQKDQCIFNSNEKLESFFNWNKANNPGTCASVTFQGSDLHRSFLCLNICGNAFRCNPPVIVLDGCPMENGSGDSLLIAIGTTIDQIVFPIAVSIVRKDCQEAWMYFLEMLKQSLDLSTNNRLVIVADRKHAETIKSLLPKTLHSFCLTQIAKEVKAKFNQECYSDILKAARAISLQEYSIEMKRIKERMPKVYHYIDQMITKENWAQHAMGRCRYNVMTLSIADPLNLSMKPLRKLQTFEFYYRFVNETYEQFRGIHLNYAKETNEYTNNFTSTLSFLTEEAKHLQVKETDKCRQFRVSKDRGNIIYRIVDLDKVSCSCNYQIHQGYPCSHLIACSLYQGENISSSIEDFYKTKTIAKAFKTNFQFCDVENLTVDNDDETSSFGPNKRLKLDELTSD